MQVWLLITILRLTMKVWRLRHYDGLGSESENSLKGSVWSAGVGCCVCRVCGRVMAIVHTIWLPSAGSGRHSKQWCKGTLSACAVLVGVGVLYRPYSLEMWRSSTVQLCPCLLRHCCRSYQESSGSCLMLRWTVKCCHEHMLSYARHLIVFGTWLGLVT